MKNRFYRLCAAIRRKRGVLVILAAVLLTLTITRVSQDGLPFVGGGSNGPSVHVTQLTKSNFQQELQQSADKAIFIMFVNDAADSRAAQIVVEEAGKKFADKTVFYSVDVMKDKEIAQLFQNILVQNGLPVQKGVPIPLYILFTLDQQSGEPVLMNVGAGVVPSSTLVTFFDQGFNPPATPPADTTPGATDGTTTPSTGPSPSGTPTPSTPSTVPSSTPASRSGS
jgi:hypothetical protein